MELKADFHIHPLGERGTTAMMDSLVREVLEAAAGKNLQCVALTDHDRTVSGVYGEEYAKKNNLEILVIPGVEITTLTGHLLALNIREPLARYRTMKDAVDLVHEAGGIAVLPHPDIGTATDPTFKFDGVECYNGAHGHFQFEDLPCAQLSNSDAHDAIDLRNATCYTLVDVDDFSPESVIEAIKAKRTRICF